MLHEAYARDKEARTADAATSSDAVAMHPILDQMEQTSGRLFDQLVRAGNTAGRCHDFQPDGVRQA